MVTLSFFSVTGAFFVPFSVFRTRSLSFFNDAVTAFLDALFTLTKTGGAGGV